MITSYVWQEIVCIVGFLWPFVVSPCMHDVRERERDSKRALRDDLACPEKSPIDFERAAPSSIFHSRLSGGEGIMRIFFPLRRHDHR